MIMLVNLRAPRKKNGLLAELWFVALTVGPWIAMIWLLWPRR